MRITTYGYPNLTSYGWHPGVYRAPCGYGDRWLVVMPGATVGRPCRAEARRTYALYREYGMAAVDA